MVAAIASGQPVENLEVQRRRKDGSMVHVSLTISPIKDTTGRVMAGTALVRDISQARAIAQSLHRSDEQLRLLIENAVDYAIFSTDLERRITTWNTGAERLLGYRSEEAVGQPADVIFTEADRARGAPEEEARLALERGRAANERKHVRRDGSEFWGSGITMPMRDDAGQAVGFVKILRDQSARVPSPAA